MSKEFVFGFEGKDGGLKVEKDGNTFRFVVEDNYGNGVATTVSSKTVCVLLNRIVCGLAKED